ncbi:hypothetical protein CYMTET_51837 [Cymbomonas tetramitiformis]|uniref:Uncharacterized protein n=1 Tax=Cymbomonas tetramitiformis TaxID=36881 RepID=A0AAE0BLW9_9CHLO|nr:hypothetical protein CYMTET_51837 [Cymbomonas tetramitiformis]
MMAHGTLCYNRLTGTVPTELGELTGMSDMYLALNRLTGTVPTELGELTRMTMLWLHSISLTGTVPTELGELTRMTSLSACGPRLAARSRAAAGVGWCQGGRERIVAGRCAVRRQKRARAEAGSAEQGGGGSGLVLAVGVGWRRHEKASGCVHSGICLGHGML